MILQGHFCKYGWLQANLLKYIRVGFQYKIKNRNILKYIIWYAQVNTILKYGHSVALYAPTGQGEYLSFCPKIILWYAAMHIPIIANEYAWI